MTDTLMFKDKTIRGNDLDLVFHKDYYWIYNEKSLPVVKYTLTNCKNLSEVDFESIDYYNDGVVVETKQEGDRSVFETTDMGDRKVKIVCAKIEKEEREYNSHDFVDLIKEIIKQRDGAYDTITTLTGRTEKVKQFLNHELDVASRKLSQAN